MSDEMSEKFGNAKKRYYAAWWGYGVGAAVEPGIYSNVHVFINKKERDEWVTKDCENRSRITATQAYKYEPLLKWEVEGKIDTIELH